MTLILLHTMDWEFPSYGGQQAARMGDYKGILKDIKKGNRKIELYNLSDDIKEQNDISSENPEIVKKFKQNGRRYKEYPECIFEG